MAARPFLPITDEINQTKNGSATDDEILQCHADVSLLLEIPRSQAAQPLRLPSDNVTKLVELLNATYIKTGVDEVIIHLIIKHPKNKIIPMHVKAIFHVITCTTINCMESSLSEPLFGTAGPPHERYQNAYSDDCMIDNHDYMIDHYDYMIAHRDCGDA